MAAASATGETGAALGADGTAAFTSGGASCVGAVSSVRAAGNGERNAEPTAGEDAGTRIGTYERA
jgi:hypothetical protein